MTSELTEKLVIWTAALANMGVYFALYRLCRWSGRQSWARQESEPIQNQVAAQWFEGEEPPILEPQMFPTRDRKGKVWYDANIVPRAWE